MSHAGMQQRYLVVASHTFNSISVFRCTIPPHRCRNSLPRRAAAVCECLAIGSDPLEHGWDVHSTRRAAHGLHAARGLQPLPSSGSAWGQLNCRVRPQKAIRLRASRISSELEEDYAADNFYELLGVSPNASSKDIKRAYYGLVKECHPDLSDDDDSAEFCMLLNDIYETLMDPERRATYDALAGFSANSINPFMDTSMPLDQVFVDELSCIGCRNCTNVCPNSFAIEDDYGRARVMRQGMDARDKLQEAIDTCPVNCIHWVTSPQLSLLEAAMARMERVAVWSLMSGGGGGRDVFTDASMAWEKRQAKVRARLQQDQDASAWQAWWNTMGGSTGANMYAQAAAAATGTSHGPGGPGNNNAASQDSEDGPFVGDRESARIAKLAAKAARASRQWKSWQELQQRSRQMAAGLLLTSGSNASKSE